MKEYVLFVSGEDPEDGWYFRCMADNRAHAVAQAMDDSAVEQVWVVYAEVEDD